jgi:putative ABC transport system permease protein
MTKILGYNNKEISRLYILATSFVVILCELITIPLVSISFGLVYRVMMIEMMTGWLPYIVDSVIYIKMFCLGMATYVIVALLEYRKVQRIPMDEALKNVE